MFAITFDLIVAELNKSHPKRVNRAYDEVRKTLQRSGFIWKQGSVYVNPDGGLAELFTAVQDLKALPWFPSAVRELRFPSGKQLRPHQAFEVLNKPENWSSKGVCSFACRCEDIFFAPAYVEISSLRQPTLVVIPAGDLRLPLPFFLSSPQGICCWRPHPPRPFACDPPSPA